MPVCKDLQFPVSVRWRGGRLASTRCPGKEPIEVATPSELHDRVAGYWSPEDLLVAAAASCFTLTLAAAAERRGAPLLGSTITATGHARDRDDGRYGLIVVEIDAELETIPAGEAAVRLAAKDAEERCLVTGALDVPVHVAVRVMTIVPTD